MADFKGRHFAAEVILWAVRWYLMFPVSYRDIEQMLVVRSVAVDHTTIFRWIQTYAGALENAVAAASVLEQWLLAGGRDLHQGQGPLDLPCIGRSTAGARPSPSCSRPGVMPGRRSGSSASAGPAAHDEFAHDHGRQERRLSEGRCGDEGCRRTVAAVPAAPMQVPEQNHRTGPSVDQTLDRAGLGFGSFRTARRTLAGYETMITKGLIWKIEGRDMKAQAVFVAEPSQLAA